MIYRFVLTRRSLASGEFYFKPFSRKASNHWPNFVHRWPNPLPTRSPPTSETSYAAGQNDTTMTTTTKLNSLKTNNFHFCWWTFLVVFTCWSSFTFIRRWISTKIYQTGVYWCLLVFTGMFFPHKTNSFAGSNFESHLCSPFRARHKRFYFDTCFWSCCWLLSFLSSALNKVFRVRARLLRHLHWYYVKCDSTKSYNQKVAIFKISFKW